VWCFCIIFWNCSDSAVFVLDFGTVPTLSEQFQILIQKHHTVGTVPKSNAKTSHCRKELFRQCGVFALDFGTVPTVWCFCIRFWNCSDSVVFLYYILELFRQCDVGTVPKSNRITPHSRNSFKI
jgi:hypothetical protein